MKNNIFDRVTEGETIEITGLPVEDHETIHLTLNNYVEFPPLAPKPFEIFVQHSSPDHFELVNVITRLSSMALREGVPLDIIANELKDIHSPNTHHFFPGTNKRCPSITARIGYSLDFFIKK